MPNTSGKWQVSTGGGVQPRWLADRERLGVEPGDRIDFVVQADGTVTVEPAIHGVAPLKGLLAVKGRRPVSLDAMRAVIRKRAAGR